MATTADDFLNALGMRRSFKPGGGGGIPVMPSPTGVASSSPTVQPGATPLNPNATGGGSPNDFNPTPYSPNDIKTPEAMPSSSGSGSSRSGSSGGSGGGASFSDTGLDFLNPKIEGAMNAAILGLLKRGGIVGRGFEDAANLLREEEKASTLRNMDRNAELFQSRNLLGSGPRLEAQTAIGDMGQQNLFAALVELELQKLAMMQQGQGMGIQGALGAGRLGLDEFLAALGLASQTVPSSSSAGPSTDPGPGSEPITPKVPPSQPPVGPDPFNIFKGEFNPWNNPYDRPKFVP